MNTFKEFQAAPSTASASSTATTATPPVLTTVEVFSHGAGGAQAAAAANAVAAGSTPQRQAVVESVSASTTAGKAQINKQDDRVTAPKAGKSSSGTAADVSAVQAAAEAARKQAASELDKQPPKEPIAKLLMDQVQALWAASASVVEASTPVAKPGAPLQTVEKTDNGSKAGAASVTHTPLAVTPRKPAVASKSDQSSSS